MANLGVTFNTYAFTAIERFDTNFNTHVPATTRMIGQSGGFNAYSTRPTPTDIGTVQVTFVLTVSDEDDMQAALDDVHALGSLGLKKLYFQPQGTAAQCWCYASVNNINLPLRAEDGLLFQRGDITFHVPDPNWYEDEDTQVKAASGVLTTDTITHTGNGIALMKVTIACGLAQTAQNPTIRRIVSGITVDEMKWTGTVGNSETLIMDARTKSVTLDGVGDFANFTFLDPSWFRLFEGDNTINIVMTGAGSRADVTFAWYPTYKR